LSQLQYSQKMNLLARFRYERADANPGVQASAVFHQKLAVRLRGASLRENRFRWRRTPDVSPSATPIYTDSTLALADESF